jgi:hypothetical protein
MGLYGIGARAMKAAETTVCHPGKPTAMDRTQQSERSPADAAARLALACRHYKSIAQGRLSRSLRTLFRELTGWDFHVEWRPALQWEQCLPLGNADSCDMRDHTGGPGGRTCRQCERHHLARVRDLERGGKSFVCPRGGAQPLEPRADTGMLPGHPPVARPGDGLPAERRPASRATGRP